MQRRQGYEFHSSVRFPSGQVKKNKKNLYNDIDVDLILTLVWWMLKASNTSNIHFIIRDGYPVPLWQ